MDDRYLFYRSFLFGILLLRSQPMGGLLSVVPAMGAAVFLRGSGAVYNEISAASLAFPHHLLFLVQIEKREIKCGRQ